LLSSKRRKLLTELIPLHDRKTTIFS